MLIAAQALAPGGVMITDNDHDFGRMSGLQVENWLR
jgi:predicted nucleic acid-binding protein